jgi:hypothetical protein
MDREFSWRRSVQLLLGEEMREHDLPVVMLLQIVEATFDLCQSVIINRRGEP